MFISWVDILEIAGVGALVAGMPVGGRCCSVTVNHDITLADSIRCAWQSVVSAVRSIGGVDEGPIIEFPES